MLTVEQLLHLAPHCDAERLAPLLSSIPPQYGIDTKLRFEHFMAQILEETGGLTAFVENLNYSAAGLIRVWPTRFGPATAEAYAHKPEQIANLVYANRGGNGDTASGDGWKYRGRGEIQVTFRDNYAQASRETGIDFVGNPDLMGGIGEGGIRATCAFWETAGCNELADKDDLIAITRRVNGGVENLSLRKQQYANITTLLAGVPWTNAVQEPAKETPVSVQVDTQTPGPVIAPVPATPAIGALNVASIARMGLGALAVFLYNHHLLSDSNAETAFVNGNLPLVVALVGVGWVLIKNRLQLTRFFQALNAPPPTS